MKNPKCSNKIYINEQEEKLSYEKKWLSYEEQYELLKSRGMSFENYPKEKALNKLEFIGYYRLSGYSYAFRKSPYNDNFVAGTEFKNIIELYKFDRKLKLILLDAIERIEIALRVALTYCLAEKSVSYIDDDSLFDLDKSIQYNSNKNKKRTCTKTVRDVLEKLRKSVDNKINRESQSSPSIEHMVSKYKKPYPLWILIQIFDFSDLCNLYQVADPASAKCISLKFGVDNPRIFTSWIQSIRRVRNICAHHARLVNRNLTKFPSIPRANDVFPWASLWGKEQIDVTKIFPLICVLHHMLKAIKASKSWDKRVSNLIKEFPYIGTKEINSAKKILGYPDRWEEILRTM